MDVQIRVRPRAVGKKQADVTVEFAVSYRMLNVDRNRFSGSYFAFTARSRS
jgi:hypothetical protein